MFWAFSSAARDPHSQDSEMWGEKEKSQHGPEATEKEVTTAGGEPSRQTVGKPFVWASLPLQKSWGLLPLFCSLPPPGEEKLVNH